MNLDLHLRSESAQGQLAQPAKLIETLEISIKTQGCVTRSGEVS